MEVVVLEPSDITFSMIPVSCLSSRLELVKLE